MSLETPETKLKSKICERLKRARQEAGYSTAKSFSERNNVKISTYALHEAGTRSMSFEIIEHYSQLLDINASWLLTGIGPQSAQHTRRVPIIDWNEVPLFPKGILLETKQYTYSDIDLSMRAFALVVQNDAMEPRYPQGTIIIVDCEQTPASDDYAIVLSADQKAPLFTQLIATENELFARPLNPLYETLSLARSTKKIGKVVQAKLVC
ncbi:MAG TPA: S24 family peptidase [Candidatus Berkiella sp.]|nr:S24 family peptidase [Candidatus Berkiella sp.]